MGKLGGNNSDFHNLEDTSHTHTFSLACRQHSVSLLSSPPKRRKVLEGVTKSLGSPQFTSSTLSVPISSSSGRETLGQFTPSSPKHFASVTKYSPGSSDTLLCLGGNKGNKVCIPVTWRFTKGSPPPISKEKQEQIRGSGAVNQLTGLGFTVNLEKSYLETG